MSFNTPKGFQSISTYNNDVVIVIADSSFNTPKGFQSISTTLINFGT